MIIFGFSRRKIVSGVMCDTSISKNLRKVVQDSGEVHNVVWFRDSGKIVKKNRRQSWR